MKHLFFVLFLLLTGSTTFAQEAEEFNCGSEITPEEEAFLNRVWSQRVDYLNNNPNRVVKKVYITIHIIRDSDGTDGISVANVNARIAEANLRYAGADIELVQCGAINYIDNSTYSTFDKYTDETIRSGNDVAGTINIYFAKSVLSSGNSICGYAKFPTSSTSSTGTNFTVVQNGCHVSTFVHELGHCFGLYHTHQSGNELVTRGSGANCTTAGDRLCDTEADPQLSSGTVNSSCVYTGSATDANGDTYVPNPNNIMSYSRKSCRTFFSAGQLSIVSASANDDYALSNCGGGGGNESCTSTVSSFPYNESFEGSSLPAGWKQQTNDDKDWTRNSGTTTSSSTGPSAASAGTWYMYTETSGSGNGYPNKVFNLLTPCFQIGSVAGAEFRFKYHMYGSNIGSLRVQASTDGGNTWSGNLFDQSGDKGNSWLSGVVNLNGYTNSTVRLRFNATSGSSYRGDIAIDDVELVTLAPVSNYANVPYAQFFSGTSLPPYWTSVSSNSFGRVQVTGANGPNGSAHITMDVTTNGNFAQNEARLGLRLQGKTNVVLNFKWKEFSDEDHVQDGVFFSSNGGSSWTKVYNLTGGSSSYQNVSLNINNLAAANGLSLTNTFMVKWQQYDNYSIATDGIAIDDINITVNGVGVADAADAEATGIKPAEAISAYPNPFTGHVNIVLPSDLEEQAELIVFDTYGRLVYRQGSLHNGETIQLGDNFAAGVYMVRLRSQTRNEVIKVIKTE